MRDVASAADPRLLDVVQGIRGPGILIYGVEFFIKEPHSRHRVGMHQDLTYWGLGAIRWPGDRLASAVPATPASNCMDFVRGSPKNPALPHKDTFGDRNLLSFPIAHPMWRNWRTRIMPF